MSVATRLSKILPGASALEREGNVLRDMWDKLSKIPGGKRVFSRTVGMMAPYTGSIDGQVVELRAGYGRVQLRDRRAVRNHLRCVHAIALANLAELAGNAALAYALPDDARFIVAGMSLEYVKKARGTITATADFDPPTTSERREYDVPVTLRNPEGEVVVRATLNTLVGPKKPSRT